MPQSKYLLVGSTEAYSGKSAAILGIAHQVRKKGLNLGYGKPLGTFPSESADGIEEDVRFLSQTLDLSSDRILPTLLFLDASTIEKRLREEDKTNYLAMLEACYAKADGDILLLEGPGTLDEGSLFGLSLPEIASAIDASVLLVARYSSILLVDAFLRAKKRLGDRLLGVTINDIAPEEWDAACHLVRPFLETHEIPVLGMMPRSSLLQSASVRELADHLGAETICGETASI